MKSHITSYNGLFARPTGDAPLRSASAIPALRAIASTSGSPIDSQPRTWPRYMRSRPPRGLTEYASNPSPTVSRPTCSSPAKVLTVDDTLDQLPTCLRELERRAPGVPPARIEEPS